MRSKGGTDGLDEAVLLRLQDTLGGEDALRSFLRLFLREGGQHVARMEDAVAAGDLDAAGLAAHSLRPTSGLLGAMPLRDACGSVEVACGQGRQKDAASGTLRVRAAFDAAAAVMRGRLTFEENAA